jgi:hypothetical protein
MPIGKLGKRNKRKKHARYRTPPRKTAALLEIPMPGGSGFKSLTGKAVHNSRDRRLVITVTGKRRQDNHGPGIFFKKAVEDWSRSKNETGGTLKVVEELLMETAGKIVKKELPERGLHLNTCNPSGKDVGGFMERTCASCQCWYCELSSS